MFFVFCQNTLLAGTNNGTIGVYGVTDGNAGSVVRPSNNETYTNNGTIQGKRGLINLRHRSGTTTINSDGALMKFSGTGGWMTGGTNSDANTSTLNNTLENHGTLGQASAGNRPVHTESTGNNTVVNHSTGSILSNNIAVSFWSNRGTNVFTNSGTITGSNKGFEASFKNRTDSLNSLSLTFTNNSNGTITGTNDYGAQIKDSTVTSLTNAGTVTSNGDGFEFNSGNTVTTFTNTGTITGGTIDIDNNGTITTLNNDQGGNDTLTYDGPVPTNYNVILNSTSDFGKIDFSNESGSLTFGIDSSSTLAANTYASVLQNIEEGNIGNEATWTNYNSTFKYRLVANGSDWDLEVANRRTGYKVRIPKARFSKIATVLENLNTRGEKSTLTSNLDSLSDVALEKAFRQIKGMTLQKSIGQSVVSNNSFKRAMTSAVQGPSFSQLVQNNNAGLSVDDLQNFYNPSVERVNLTNDFTISDIASIYSKRNLFQIGEPDSSFFLRTFGGLTDQGKVGDDIGYSSTTAGFVFGNQSVVDNLQAGWGLGFSTTGLDYDEGYGLNNTHSFHSNFFVSKTHNKFDTSLNLGSFISKNNSTRNVTEGSTQTLKSERYDIGLDLTGGISKKFNLGGWIFNPTASINTSYVIQDDIDESGGDLALKIKTDNLLHVKQELGFNLDREFSNDSFISNGFNFSLYGSEENKLDGADTDATIKDTGDGFTLTDDKKRDQFITAGLGFVSSNSQKNSQFLINAFGTQNTSNDMNSSLISLSYNKKF